MDDRDGDFSLFSHNGFLEYIVINKVLTVLSEIGINDVPEVLYGVEIGLCEGHGKTLIPFSSIHFLTDFAV